MNKEEVIRGINSERYVGLTTYEDEAYNRGLDIALCYINQIDEPVKPPEPEPWKSEKPTIPQYVADWIEDNREALEGYVYSNIQIVLPRIQDDNPMHSWLNGKGIDIFVDCIRNGYEVEKEKLYTARLEIIDNERESYINKDTKTDEIFLDDLTGLDGKFQVNFTQAELEELNVWDNPAFEVEEVKK